MMAVKTTLSAKELPDSLNKVRSSVEKAVPHGRTKSVSVTQLEGQAILCIPNVPQTLT